MFARLKKTLVESYVGTIALGWIFAQSILHLINVITAPLGAWEQQQLMTKMHMADASHAPVSLLLYLPELIAAIALALVGLLLLRWLYYSPSTVEVSSPE